MTIFLNKLKQKLFKQIEPYGSVTHLPEVVFQKPFLSSLNHVGRATRQNRNLKVKKLEFLELVYGLIKHDKRQTHSFQAYFRLK